MNDTHNSRRSLREILPKKTAAADPIHRERIRDTETEPPTFRPQTERSYAKPPRRGPSRTALWGGAVLCLGIFVFALSMAFAQATVRITPKQGKVVLAETITATSKPQEDGVTFKVMSMEDTESKTVPASGTEKVEKKASGTIIIYNGFDTSPQALVANTRFETKDGKIYRIAEPVTVPGGRQDGSTLVPGSVEAVVYADQPGPEYNIEQGDFTVPGFKGSPRFDKFYARTKTAMTGGFVGQAKAVSDDDRAKARAELQQALKDRIVQEARLQIPPDFILYDDGIFLSFEEATDPAATAGEGEAIITEKAVLSAVLLNTKELGSYLAERNTTDATAGDVTISNPQELSVRFNDKANIDLRSAESISFAAEGNAHLIWSVDEGALKKRLAEASDGDFEAVFAQFPAIEKAEVVFRPPWIRSFPAEAEKIKVTTVLAK